MTTSTTPLGISSTGYIFLGSLLCLIGFMVVVGVTAGAGFDGMPPSALLGFLLGAVGSLLVLIGVVAKGVALGIEEHRRSL